MYVAEEMAEEIYQVYASGKNGIVLEAEHRQEWEPVVDILQKKYFTGGIAPLAIRYGEKEVPGKTSFEPALYQRLHILRQMPEDSLGLGKVARGSYLAIALEKIKGQKGLELLVIENYHLFDRENREKALLALLSLLETGAGKSGLLILLTVSHLDNLPAELFPYVHVIRGRKPGMEEIQDRLGQILAAKGLGIGERFKREIVSYLQGFQGFEIEYLLERAERNYGEDAFDEKKKKILELIGNEKVKLLERDRLLEWKMVEHVDMANMERIGQHLHESGMIMGRLEDAVQKGVAVPKGILVMGLPGTGKSLFAQYAAAELKMPLIRLEMGRMMGGHVGDSERNLRLAQRQAEEMAPCILWMDEIEKGFAGTGGQGREEGAYLQRMAGGFLTWLQEKKSSCYIIATANGIDGLPPEFFRKGRFDECFYTSMPSEAELRKSLKVHLMKPERAHVEAEADGAIDEVMGLAVAEKRFMTGADASALVSNVFRRLYLDFESQAALTDKTAYDRANLKAAMVGEFRKIKVFSETNGEEIARYDKASKKSNFVRASDASQGGKTRYDNRLEAFIAMETEKAALDL